MAQVFEMPAGEGSFLGALSFYRMPDGAIRVKLEDMAPHVIESHGTVSARMFEAAKWCSAGVVDLAKQGLSFAGFGVEQPQ